MLVSLYFGELLVDVLGMETRINNSYLIILAYLNIYFCIGAVIKPETITVIQSKKPDYMC